MKKRTKKKKSKQRDEKITEKMCKSNENKEESDLQMKLRKSRKLLDEYGPDITYSSSLK